MYILLAILWIAGICIGALTKYQDTKITGYALALVGSAGCTVLNLLTGNVFFLLTGFCVWLNYSIMKKLQIAYGLSWKYAIQMTMRRLVGDL